MVFQSTSSSRKPWPEGDRRLALASRSPVGLPEGEGSSSSEESLGSTRVSAVTTCKRDRRPAGTGGGQGGPPPSASPAPEADTLAERQASRTPGLLPPPGPRSPPRGSLREAAQSPPGSTDRDRAGWHAGGKSEQGRGGGVGGRERAPGAGSPPRCRWTTGVRGPPRRSGPASGGRTCARPAARPPAAAARSGSAAAASPGAPSPGPGSPQVGWGLPGPHLPRPTPAHPPGPLTSWACPFCSFSSRVSFWTWVRRNLS